MAKFVKWHKRSYEVKRKSSEEKPDSKMKHFEYELYLKLCWLGLKFKRIVIHRCGVAKMTYQQFCDDMNDRMGVKISTKTMKKYLWDMRDRGIIDITRLGRSLMQFTVMDEELLEAYVKEFDELIRGKKEECYGKNKKQESQFPIQEGLLPIQESQFPIQEGLLIPKSSLKSSPKSSLRKEDFFDGPREDEDRLYKASYDAVCHVYGKPIQETVKFVHEKLTGYARRESINDLFGYACKICDNLKLQGHGFGNPYADHIQSKRAIEPISIPQPDVISIPRSSGGGYPRREGMSLLQSILANGRPYEYRKTTDDYDHEQEF